MSAYTSITLQATRRTAAGRRPRRIGDPPSRRRRPSAERGPGRLEEPAAHAIRAANAPRAAAAAAAASPSASASAPEAERGGLVGASARRQQGNATGGRRQEGRRQHAPGCRPRCFRFAAQAAAGRPPSRRPAAVSLPQPDRRHQPADRPPCRCQSARPLRASAAREPAGRLPVRVHAGLAGVPRVVRIAPNRAAAPRDLRFGQNERLGASAIRRFGNS